MAARGGAVTAAAGNDVSVNLDDISLKRVVDETSPLPEKTIKGKASTYMMKERE